MGGDKDDDDDDSITFRPPSLPLPSFFWFCSFLFAYFSLPFLRCPRSALRAYLFTVFPLDRSHDKRATDAAADESERPILPPLPLPVAIYLYRSLSPG